MSEEKNNNSIKKMAHAGYMLDLLIEALPYVEEGEKFNKPFGKNRLSTKIKIMIERLAEK